MLKHLFTLDEATNDILRELPPKKKSAFVREAIQLKARMLTEVPTTPQLQNRTAKKVKITI